MSARAAFWLAYGLARANRAAREAGFGTTLQSWAHLAWVQFASDVTLETDFDRLETALLAALRVVAA